MYFSNSRFLVCSSNHMNRKYFDTIEYESWLIHSTSSYRYISLAQLLCLKYDRNVEQATLEIWFDLAFKFKLNPKKISKKMFQLTLPRCVPSFTSHSQNSFHVMLYVFRVFHQNLEISTWEQRESYSIPNRNHVHH